MGLVPRSGFGWVGKCWFVTFVTVVTAEAVISEAIRISINFRLYFIMFLAIV